MTSNRITIANLEELLIKQYSQDFSEHGYDEKSELLAEDKQFLGIAAKSITLKDGHYQLRLPFRAMNLIKRFRRDEPLFADYKSFMSDILEKGHAERVPQEQLHGNDGKVWYIPHYGVYHKRKGKIREVFDCTASFHGTWQQWVTTRPQSHTLLGVILLFCQEPVALMADIEGMFHQVQVSEHNLDFLHFLWWPNNDINLPLAEYRMKVHLFGAVSSPSCANYALKKTADENASKVGEDI